LRDLGHARYGSRLHELVGEPNTQQSRLRARSFVLQALAEEPRVSEVLELDVRPHTAVPDRILISFSVRPAGPGSFDSLSAAVEVDL
jgi:phage baseplate assembly protein W